MEAPTKTVATATATRAAPPAAPSSLTVEAPPVALTAPADTAWLLAPADRASRTGRLQSLQRAVGNAAVTALVQRVKENEAPLSAIQGRAMYDLLPALAALPPAQQTDEAAAGFVGGQRLVIAQRAVRSKDNWQGFAAANTAEMTQLPVDQIEDMMRFIGPPAEVKTYDRSNFDGRFDALVDPTTGQITLMIRVKIEKVEGTSYSGDPVGSKPWIESNDAVFQAWKPRFKDAVEQAWSGTAAVTAVKPIVKSLKAPVFRTKVVVQLAEAGEHVTFQVFGGSASGEVEKNLRPGQTSRHGALSVGDLDKHPTSLKHGTGEQVNSSQVTAAHELGHAMGLPHVACEGNAVVCYGTTNTEYADIMGGGSGVGRTTVTTGGGKTAGVHDNLKPFERIGERWSQDVFPGSLAGKLGGWAPA